MKGEAVLHGWRLCAHTTQCLSVGGLHLHGRVFGHRELPDGEYIRTSQLVEFWPEIGIAETRNTVYILRGGAADAGAKRVAECARDAAEQGA